MTLAARGRRRTRSASGSHHNRQALPGRLLGVDEDGERKLGLAFMLACPACAGGFFLAIGAAFGATALALKGFALAAILTLGLGIWARNYWRRSKEEACKLPASEGTGSP